MMKYYGDAGIKLEKLMEDHHKKEVEALEN